MKKVAYLIIVVLAITMMSFSCSKKEDDDDLPNIITVNDLVGDWHFQSLEFKGNVYDTDAKLDELWDEGYRYIKLSFLNVLKTEIGLHEHSTGITSRWDYTLSNDKIDIYANGWSGGFVFYIENWETFDGTVLKVKYVSSGATTKAPFGGVITMTLIDN